MTVSVCSYRISFMILVVQTIYLLACLSFQQIRDYQARWSDMDLICSAHKLQSNSPDSRSRIFVVHNAVTMVVVMVVFFGIRSTERSRDIRGWQKTRMEMTDVDCGVRNSKAAILVWLLLLLYVCKQRIP